MKKTTILIFLIVILFLQASAAYAKTTMQDVSMELVTPCCKQLLANHADSDQVLEMKAEIKEMIGKGMTKQEILDAFVKKYGVTILAAPPKKGFDLIAAYILPFAVALLTAVGVVAVVLKWSRKKEDPDESGDSGQSGHGELEARIEEELKAFDY